MTNTQLKAHFFQKEKRKKKKNNKTFVRAAAVEKMYNKQTGRIHSKYTTDITNISHAIDPGDSGLFSLHLNP